MQYVNASQQASSDTVDEAEWQIQFGFHCKGAPKEDVMKRNLIGILSLVVMAVMMNATAHAQTVARANVPFAFKVGSAKLPAGSYVINTDGDMAVEIHDRNSKASVLTGVRREDSTSTGSKLIFHRVGGEYFLAKICRGAGSQEMVIPTSKQEKSLEKELRLAGGQPPATEEVMIALN
jgi:hypothetical protein